MRYLGLLITVVIIALAAVYLLRSFGMTNNSGEDAGSVKWYYAHDQERTAKLQWCNQNPQSQDSPECRNATAAQTQVDIDKQQQQQQSQPQE